MKRKVEVESFLKHREIPQPLASKVADFCNYTLNRKVVKEEGWRERGGRMGEARGGGGEGGGDRGGGGAREIGALFFRRRKRPAARGEGTPAPGGGRPWPAPVPRPAPHAPHTTPRTKAGRPSRRGVAHWECGRASFWSTACWRATKSPPPPGVRLPGAPARGCPPKERVGELAAQAGRVRVRVCVRTWVCAGCCPEIAFDRAGRAREREKERKTRRSCFFCTDHSFRPRHRRRRRRGARGPSSPLTHKHTH